MKILHLVHNYYGFSGASRQAKNIAKGILAAYPDIEQRFFTFKSKMCEHYDGDKSDFIVYSSKPHSISKIYSLLKVIILYRPEIIHFHGADFLMLIVCKLMGIQVYWKTTLYGSDDFTSLFSGRFGTIKKFLTRFIDMNNTLTHQIRKEHNKFLLPERMVTIPNGVNIPSVVNVDEKINLAVIVSAIIPRKSVLEGIFFFNKNLRKLGYKLFIVGPSSPRLDGFSPEYLDECKNHQDDNVIFLGEISHEKTLDILRKARFLIHLSRSEGMPNVVLEAMAYSVYPILSDMNGLTEELIDDGVTGFNVEKRNDFSLLKHLSYNAKGRDSVIEKNSFDIVSSKTVDVYEVLKNGTSQRKDHS
ncbi:glycosyltransferase family 4 protein [Aeromonas caviae]